MTNNSFCCVLFLSIVWSGALPAQDVELEGPLKSVHPTTAELSVMGMRVILDSNTKIESPSATLTVKQLKDSTPLPGRTEKGFEGGTATVTGTVDPATGIVTAATVFVEPSENVILGVVTENNAGQLKINGVQIRYLNDSRMPLKAVQNEFGFAVKRESIPVGTPASVEGYFDGTDFQAFLVEIDGPAELEDPNPQLSILRAQTRERRPNKGDDVNVRSDVTTAHVTTETTTQTIGIYRVDDGVEALITTVRAQSCGRHSRLRQMVLQRRNKSLNTSRLRESSPSH
ncbi:MAG: hypothetical protein R3C49_15690 [Planctomycetaceae bacterium]